MQVEALDGKHPFPVRLHGLRQQKVVFIHAILDKQLLHQTMIGLCNLA